MDGLFYCHTEIGQWSIIRAINDRSNIFPKEILSIVRADSYKISIRCAVIVFCQAVLLSLW